MVRKLQNIPNDIVKSAEIVQLNQENKGWQGQFKLDGNGVAKTKSIFNAQLIIEHDENLKNLIAYDEFSEQLVKTRASETLKITKGYWNDSDDSMTRAYIERAYNLLFSKEIISDAVVGSSKNHTVNPVKTRIESVKWDKKPRVASYFIDYLGAEDSEYTRAVTKAWLVGAVGRVYRPGIKFELVPIIEGKQGLGKSTVARNLFPDVFNDSIDGLGMNKDDYQSLNGSWIVEIAELSAMKKTNIDKMKNFISAQSDTYRNSYGRYSMPHPRKCVFIGSTNQRDFLKDSTGERRFFPIHCGINKATKQVWKVDDDEILQLLAEAKEMFDNDEPLYLDKQMMKIAKKYQSDAQTIDPMKDAIQDFLEIRVPANWQELSNSIKQTYAQGVLENLEQSKWLAPQLKEPFTKIDRTTTREILNVVFGKSVDKYLTGAVNNDAKKVKLIMDNMDGWESKANVVVGGRRSRGYVRN